MADEPRMLKVRGLGLDFIDRPGPETNFYIPTYYEGHRSMAIPTITNIT